MNSNYSATLDTNTKYWQLIDRIYETGQSPHAWPVLLDSLFISFGMHQNSRKAASGGVKSSLRLLSPHFERALKLNRYLDNTDSALEDGIYSDLPYPIVVVNEKLEIVYRNVTGSLSFPPQSEIVLEKHRITVSLSNVAAKITHMLDEASNKMDHQPVVLLHRETRPNRSLVAISLQSSSGHRFIALAWLDPMEHGRLSTDHFRQLYDLTEAESRLLDLILCGAETNQVAERLSVAPATVRAHLKSIYRKTATKRKAELIQTVMCGPVFLNRFLMPRADMFTDSDVARQRQNQSIFLSDGRRLGFAEYGSPEGTPIMLVHNLIGSRMQLPTNERNLIAQNLRLIIPDRPGVGLSGVSKSHSMNAWSQDIVELTDHLGLQRFHLIGSSLGSVYGLALAHCIPERIARFAMVSCLPEMTNPGSFRELIPSTRRLFTLVRYAPVAVDFVLKMIVRKGPEAYLDKLVCDLPDIDQELYRDPAFHRMMVAAVTETLHQGTSSLLKDIQIMASPWEFRSEEIRVPVHCWHGKNDTVAPYRLVRNLSSTLQDCEFNLLEDETHWLLYRQWNSIIARLIN